MSKTIAIVFIILHTKYMKNGFAHILLILVVLIIAAGGLYFFLSQKKPQYPQNDMPNISDSHENLPKDVMSDKGGGFKLVSEPVLLFTGGYADPTIAHQGSTLIMYLNNFSKQPATYEAHTSADGLDWTKTTAKLPNASTGRAVQFDDQTRLYYPDQTPIRPTDPPASILSALSDDGFNFTNESGTRVDPRDGYYLEGPTVLQTKDGSYRMYFSENESASAEKRISAIWGASSDDGLVWSRDSKPTIEATEKEEHIPAGWPQALHPFVLTRPDGSFLMFYNTHSEVYAAESSDGINWTKIGDVGIHGADVDGYYLENGNIRLYYGDFSEETSGVVYTVDMQEI